MITIVTLTMNPAVDVSTSVDRVEPVRKLRCGPGRRDPGGGGINVARVAQRLGADAIAVYPAGGLTGQLLTGLVEQEAVRTIVVPVTGETREDFTVLDATSNEEYRFILPGPHLRGSEWLKCLETLATLEVRPDFVCASGSLPQDVPADFYARVAEIVASWGVKLALDTSGPALKRALDEPVYLLKPNLRELRDLTGEALDDQPSVIAACQGLLKRGSAQVIALTLGSEGAMLLAGDRIWRADALPIQPVSSVGAGDSFLGAMVWALAGGKPLPEAFRFGMAAGSAALLAHGTELCRPQDVRRLLERVVIEELGEEACGAAS